MLQIESKLIVITREDITPGYQCVQSGHAIADFSYQHPEIFKKWKLESNSIICLSAKSEQHLLQLFHKYSEITPTTKFYEPDIDQWTSLCLYADPSIRKTLKHLPLLLKNKN